MTNERSQKTTILMWSIPNSMFLWLILYRYQQTQLRYSHNRTQEEVHTSTTRKIRHPRSVRKVMRLIFYLPKFLFFKHQCSPLQNSFFGQLHTDGDIVPTFGSSARSLQPVWFSACPLHSFGSFLKSPNEVLRSQVMNHGLFNNILRPRCKVRSGALRVLLDQRKFE